MILKFGIKNGYLEYIQIDAKFPSKQEKKDLDVLSKANQKSSWSIYEIISLLKI